MISTIDNKKLVKFSSLARGETFRRNYANCVYTVLKEKLFDDCKNECNAFSFTYSCGEYIDEDEMVEPLDVCVVINK